MFAKLFETDLGQILVKIDDGDDGVEVRVYFEPEGLGVCSVAYTWPNSCSDEQLDKAEGAFEKLDEDACIKKVSAIMERLSYDDE